MSVKERDLWEFLAEAVILSESAPADVPVIVQVAVFLPPGDIVPTL